MIQKKTKKPIIFFDGECAVCNRFVSFLLQKDKGDIFVFCGLGSEYAKKNLPLEIQEIDSIVLKKHNRYLIKSKAIIEIFANLGVGYRVLSFLMSIFPAVISDYFYTIFAKNRNKIHTSCNLELQKKSQHKVIF